MELAADSPRWPAPGAAHGVAGLGGQVHVWLAEVAKVGRPALDQAHAALSPSDRRRLAVMAPGPAVREFLAGRALTGRALAHYCGLAIEDLPIGTEPSGKPRLAHPTWGQRLQLNLGHAAGFVACAVAAGSSAVRVGVDLESVTRPIDVEGIAARFFADQEARHLARIPASRRRSAFFTSWTLKEAYLKATGAGLTVPLARVAFDLAGDSPRLQSPPPGPRWSFGVRRCRGLALAAACNRPRAFRFRWVGRS